MRIERQCGQPSLHSHRIHQVGAWVLLGLFHEGSLNMFTVSTTWGLFREISRNKSQWFPFGFWVNYNTSPRWLGGSSPNKPPFGVGSWRLLKPKPTLVCLSHLPTSQRDWPPKRPRKRVPGPCKVLRLQLLIPVLRRENFVRKTHLPWAEKGTPTSDFKRETKCLRNQKRNQNAEDSMFACEKMVQTQKVTIKSETEFK